MPSPKRFEREKDDGLLLKRPLAGSAVSGSLSFMVDVVVEAEVEGKGRLPGGGVHCCRFRRVGLFGDQSSAPHR
jgi:hypothetical protein